MVPVFSAREPGRNPYQKESLLSAFTCFHTLVDGVKFCIFLGQVEAFRGLVSPGKRRMQLPTRNSLRFLPGLTVFLTLGAALFSQDIHSVQYHSAVPYDWSHRHLIFSAPATLENSVRIQGNARYWHQLARRNANVVLPTEPQTIDHIGAGERENGILTSSIMSRRERRWFRRGQLITRDWGVPLGAGATAGAGSFPAKFSFDVNTANCGTDYVVFNTSLASTATQAGIVAFSNLYSGCGGTVPATSWAYKTTGTGDSCTACTVLTSAVLSIDGSQVAFVGSSAGGSFLYLLKPKAAEGTVGAPAQPTTSTTTPSSYVTCRNGATSCLLSLPLGSAADTNSAPFYDYTNDALYVGENGGVLYKFTGVFRGTPAKLTTGGWPVIVNSGSTLTAPVYDQVSGNVYVGDSSGVLRFVRDTSSTVGACVTGSPPCLANKTVSAGAGNPIVDAPLVDSTTQKVFVTVGRDSGGNVGLFQAPTDLTTNVEATLGPQFGNTFYDGAFDKAYYTSVGNGHLYVCGNVSTSFFLNLFQNLALFRVGFNASGTMTGVQPGSITLTNQVLTLTGPFPSCSPATEISGPSSDLLFLSVNGNGSQIGCGSNACLMSFALPTLAPFTFPTAAFRTLPASDGTSGIVVDNTVTSPAGTSQIYFTPLSNSTAGFPCGSPNTTGVGCAIQASQSGLN
jgi:hypothetical protein